MGLAGNLTAGNRTGCDLPNALGLGRAQVAIAGAFLIGLISGFIICVCIRRQRTATSSVATVGNTPKVPPEDDKDNDDDDDDDDDDGDDDSMSALQAKNAETEMAIFGRPEDFTHVNSDEE